MHDLSLFLGCDETEYGYGKEEEKKYISKTGLVNFSSLILFPLIEVPYPFMFIV